MVLLGLAVAALSLISTATGTALGAPRVAEAGKGMSAPAPPSVTVDPTGNTIVERRAVISSDDAEEDADGNIFYNNTDIELVRDSTDQIVGIRWTLLVIPRGAIIESAYVQFGAKEAQSEPTNLTIHGQASSSAPTFGPTLFNISTRPLTTSAASWSPAPWAAGEAGPDQRTPDLSAVIQEVVNRPGWTSGNAIALIISGTGRRTAWAYNGNHAAAPLLHVEYVTAPPDLAPIAALTVTQPATPALTVNADASGSTDTDLTPIASYQFDFGDGTAPVITTAPTATASHTYAAAGTYTIALIVTDTGGNASEPATTIVNVIAPIALERRTGTSSDDAEEFANGGVSLNSSDLELVHDTSDQTVGMRWTNLTIPPGATITAAYLQFSAKESQSEATILTIRGQAADNPATFSTTANNVSTRPRTVAAGTWAPVPWTAGEAGPNQRTPDLSPVVQEVVGRPGWASGNALVIIITGSGHRTPWSRDGSTGGAPLLHVEYTTGPPPENPPVARLAVTQVASPPFTVNADGSTSTDVDLTPIASYQFDFGDGTAPVTTIAPTATASHTYAAADTYIVTLIATDTGGFVSAPATASITVIPDSAPVARLTVAQAASPPLTVSADGSASTDSDFTPIATYWFDFGDGTPPVTKTAPTATASHTYAAADTYIVTLIATDTGGNASPPDTASIIVSAMMGPPIAVYTGYYDTHHIDTTNPKPDPWMGSPGIVFVGTPDTPSGGWDSSALRVDNLSGAQLTGVVVTVDIGSSHFALWGSRSIPVGQKLLLAQTAFENFDGSDLNPAGCFDCDPSLCLTQVQSTVPVVHVTIGGTTTHYYDTEQILNTHGVDAAGCPYTGGRNDESEVWHQIHPSGAGPSRAQQSGTGDLQAAPAGGPLRLTSPYPNPVRADFSFGFRTPSRGPVRLAIYDVSGRLVKTYLDGVLDAAEYRGVVDMRGTPAGVYYCTLRTPAGTLRKTLVLTP